MVAMAERLALAFLLVAAAVVAASAVDSKLTLHNLCPFTVYPLVTPIADNTVQLDGNGRGLVSFPFPATFWSGRVVARTGCASPTSCETGTAPPMTVVQLAVHSPDAGPGADLATYSVSLTDGFNVGAAVSPQFIGGGQCPVLGCPVNLNDGWPVNQRVVDRCGVAWWRARGTH
ncbi:hypothetical protein ACQ4PT_049551 [Festuca glaucescens]